MPFAPVMQRAPEKQGLGGSCLAAADLSSCGTQQARVVLLPTFWDKVTYCKEVREKSFIQNPYIFQSRNDPLKPPQPNPIPGLLLFSSS